MRIDQSEQLASLARDLGTVATIDLQLEDDRDDYARARLVYTRQQKDLYGEPRARDLGKDARGETSAAPELEIARVLRILATRRKLSILKDELDGRRITCLLPSRVEVRVELLGARP